MDNEEIKEYNKEFEFIFDTHIKDWITGENEHILYITPPAKETQIYNMNNKEDIKKLYINDAVNSNEDDLFSRVNNLIDYYIKNTAISQDMSNYIYDAYLQNENELINN
jgi:hypothetical protein